MAGVTVITDFSSCTDTTYRTAASGILSSNAKCGFDLTAAPFSTAAWDYRYFKLCAQNTTSPNGQSITNFRVAGNVPSGMVMVHLDDWPIHEFANTTIVPFTYAIDKWETYLSSGVITNGTPGVCTATNCISSSTGVMSSATGHAPTGNIDWYASRKGCTNRTAAGYTGASTPRTIHLQTEMENFVANYGTPDNYFTDYGYASQLGYVGGFINAGYGGCNIDAKHTFGTTVYAATDYYNTGDPATKNCISRYGARDLIGNFGESFDGYYENMNNAATRQKSVYWGTTDKITTVISDALLGYSISTGPGTYYYVHAWDYQNLLPNFDIGTPSAPNPEFYMDVFHIQNGTGYHASSYDWGSGTQLGRFQKEIDTNPTNTQPTRGPRCAIVSP